MLKHLNRRKFLQLSANSTVALLSVSLLNGCKSGSGGSPTESVAPKSLALLPPDANGCRLPEGFSSRIVARSSEVVIPGSGFRWHGAPDGGACFAQADGWIYVSNSELGDGMGGASALKFDLNGSLVDAYPILEGSWRNCAGGPSPRGTWLSCEESGDAGRVFECDPRGLVQASECRGLGRFNHEAVAYDPSTHQLYLTEDRADGRFYRYTPDSLVGGFADLQSGVLESAELVEEGQRQYIRWHPILDPSGEIAPTRQQSPESTAFNRGEGIVCSEGRIVFTTTGDNTVWSYEPQTGTIRIVYRGSRNATELRGVDNITANKAGDLLIAEDGGEMRVVQIDEEGSLRTLVQLEGHDHSEIAGIAFDPSYTRLYFSSQRGQTGESYSGITFEITGPF